MSVETPSDSRFPTWFTASNPLPAYPTVRIPGWSSMVTAMPVRNNTWSATRFSYRAECRGDDPLPLRERRVHEPVF